MRTKFKADQRVFDFFFGWGTIKKIETKYISVLFDKKPKEEIWYHLNGTICEQVTDKPTLATKEYALEGFTQEPIIDYSEYFGTWGVFYDDMEDFENTNRIGKLYSYEKDSIYPFKSCEDESYKNFKPLTEEQIKILNL